MEQSRATGPTGGHADGVGVATYLAFVAAALLAGANAVAVKFSNAELAPFWGAGLRFTCAAGLLFVLVAALRLSPPPKEARLGVLLYGLFNFGLSYACLYWALQEVTAGTAMLALAVVPMITFVIAVAIGQESFCVRGLVGALIAFAGIGLVVGNSLGAASPLALLLLMGGATSIAIVPVVVKHFPRVHAVVENAFGMLAGGVLLLGLSAIAGDRWTLPGERATQAAVLYLILLGSIGMFLLIMYVIRRLSASSSAYIILLSPLSAMGLGALFFGEQPSPLLLAGGGLVMLGVYVGIAPPRRAPTAPPLAGDPPGA